MQTGMNEYQQEAKKYAVYPAINMQMYDGIGRTKNGAIDQRGAPTERRADGELLYTALGLCGEAGEFADKLKKWLRDGENAETRDGLVKELGDVLWYVAACATELGLSLGVVADINLNKLANRAQKNTLHGSGDER